MKRVIFEYKNKNKSIIFFDDNSFMTVVDSFIKENGKYTFLENNDEYKTFLLKGDDSQVSVLMFDYKTQIVFYTYKRGKLSRSRVKML